MKYVITKYRGEYIEWYDDKCCSWSYIRSSAMTFDTYQKAYYNARKINKYYGHNVARVEKFNN